MDIEDFYTKSGADNGITLPLTAPDGSPTDHWVKIRGVDSEVFQQAKLEANRESLSLLDEKDETKRRKRILDLKIKLASALVIEWSFDKKCDEKGVVELFTNAPQIMDKIDEIAGNRQLFFSILKKESENTPKPRQNSTRGRKTQS